MSDLTERLIRSAEIGHILRVGKLLDEGADVNAQGPNAGALHMAAFNGYVNIVKLLVKRGADIELASAQGFTALHLAASNGRGKVVRALLKANANPNSVTPEGGTPLHVAVASGHADAARSLIKGGADLSIKDGNGRVALHFAVGDLSILKALLKAGADPNPRDNKDNTPLRLAVLGILRSRDRFDGWISEGSNGSVTVKYEAIKGMLFYTKGSQKPRQLPTGELRQIARLDWAPRGLSAFLVGVDIALALVKAGADPMIGNHKGFTSLHEAASLGDPRLLKAMVKCKGVDWLARTTGNSTPIHSAAGSERPDGIKLMLKSVDSKQINVVDRNGYTPLHTAAYSGGPAEIFRALLRAGADPTAKTTRLFFGTKVGTTPLELARERSNEDAISVLSEA